MTKKNAAISGADHDLHTQNTRTLKKSGIRYKGQINGNKPKAKKQPSPYPRSNRTATLSDASFAALSLSQLPAAQWQKTVQNVILALLDKNGRPFVQLAMGKFPAIAEPYIQLETPKGSYKKSISTLDWKHICTNLFPGEQDPAFSMMRLATNKKRGHTNTRIRIRIHFVDRQDFVHTDLNNAVLFSFVRLLDDFALLDLLEKLLTA